MPQMVLAALENQKRISATKDVTDAFLLLCEYLNHRLRIVVVKLLPVKERSVLIDVEKQKRIISYCSLPDLI